MAKKPSVKNEAFDSKQIKSSKRMSSKDKIEAKITALEVDEKEIRGSIAESGTFDTKLSHGILSVFKVENTALPEPTVDIQLKDRNTMDIIGDSKKGATYGKSMKKQLESFIQGVTTFTHTGLHNRIQQARINAFLESRLPILKHSAMLFIDDINNGSYRGGEFSRNGRFGYWRNGNRVTDENEIRRMNDILNPTEYFRLINDYKRFDDIDTMGDYIQRRDGNSCTRLVSHKEVAKELYVKYIMKEAKKKQVGLPERAEGSSDIPGQESWVLRTTYGEKPIGGYDAMELTTDESFLEFAQRYAEKRVYRPYSLFETDRHAMTVEVGGYPETTLSDVVRNIARAATTNKMYIGTESVEKVMFGLESSLSSYDKGILENCDFQDIYNINFSSIKGYAGISMESANGMTAPTPVTIGSTLEQLGSRLLHMLDSSDLMSSYGLETEFNILSPTAGTTVFRQDGGISTGVGSSIISDKSALTDTSTSNQKRLDKMFQGVKGETVEYLDNTRAIPLMVGQRFLGSLYIEFTHQDIQHLIGVRTIMNSPASYIQNMDTMYTEAEKQEETLGRLAFTDIIKPILEKNMDLKFLKENTDILYTVNKLLEENELSAQSLTDGTLQSNIYNMSRVIFIPANEIIFKRQGQTALGESKFQEALTPATCAILANDSYLSWILGEGKGTSFITIPRGMSEVSSENGVQPLEDRIKALFPSRGEMRDLIYADVPLAHNIVVMYKDDAAQSTIDVNTIEMPEFSIDKETLKEWKQEATDIVGYNVALYTSTDGNIELASKLFEMNDTKIISLIEDQNAKRQASSILATRLLKLRGGVMYDDVVVEWIPPDINKGNNTKLNEIIEPKKNAFNTYMEIFDAINDGDDEWPLIRQRVAINTLQRLAKDDDIIVGMEDLFNRARSETKFKVASELKEEDAGSENTGEDDE